MRTILLFSIFVFTLFRLPLCAQSEKRSITGHVIDSLIKEPLPYVNVFFANSTLGTSTLVDGTFSITAIPPGKYNLIASFVGYQPYMLTLDFSDSEQGFKKEIKLTIELVQEAKQLKEIIVKEDTTDWVRNFEAFKLKFLGDTRNSKQCKILNPRDIHLYFDTRDKVLVAHAKKPIVIENLALGYKVYHYLYQFETNYQTGLTYSFGVPRYEELISEKARKNKSWQRERARAFFGSVGHFMRALRDTALQKNSFTVQKIYTVKNIARPPDHLIEKKIAEWKAKNKSMTFDLSAKPNDSLVYYLRLKSQPKEVDSVGTRIYSGSEFLRTSADKFDGIKGKYQMVYDGKEEREYLRNAGRDFAAKQKSTIHFLHDTMKIYPNGYYEDVRSLLIEGYLSWREKIANMLPLEYAPPSLK